MTPSSRHARAMEIAAELAKSLNASVIEQTSREIAWTKFWDRHIKPLSKSEQKIYTTEVPIICKRQK